MNRTELNEYQNAVYVNKKLNNYTASLYNIKATDSDFYYEDGTNESNKNRIPSGEVINIKEYLKHRNDQILDTGYNYYSSGILTKALSGVFFIEPKRKAIINQFDKLFIFMVNHIKSIKKTYNYILPKNYTKFN